MAKNQPEKAAESKETPEAHAQSADVVFQAQAPEPSATKQSLEELEEEIRLVELATKRIQLAEAKRSNEKYVQTEEERKANAIAVQRTIAAEARHHKNLVAQCNHLTGGYGKEDFYDGDGKPSLIRTDTPIQGISVIFCHRCHGRWTTPDPNLKRTDPEKYADLASEWLLITKMEKQSLNKGMSGPSFVFTNEDGVPVVPALR